VVLISLRGGEEIMLPPEAQRIFPSDTKKEMARGSDVDRKGQPMPRY
jgi:hypothetical protein